MIDPPVKYQSMGHYRTSLQSSYKITTYVYIHVEVSLILGSWRTKVWNWNFHKQVSRNELVHHQILQRTASIAMARIKCITLDSFQAFLTLYWSYPLKPSWFAIMRERESASTQNWSTKRCTKFTKILKYLLKLNLVVQKHNLQQMLN